MNKDYMMKLLTAIKNHKPLKIYLENEYYDTFYFKSDKYQGQFGYLSMKDVIRKVNNNNELPHIALEVAE